MTTRNPTPSAATPIRLKSSFGNAVEDSASAATAPRLSWLMLIMALIAFATLFVTEAGAQMASPVLPCLALGLAAAWFVPARIERTSNLNWVLRIALYSLIVVVNRSRFASESANIFETHTMGMFGELFAAELVLQAWRKPPSASRTPNSSSILLSGLVVMAASTTPEDRYLPFLIPAYILFVVLSLRTLRPSQKTVWDAETREGGRQRAGSYAARWVALLSVLAIGGGGHYVVRFYRNELTSWGMNLLHEVPLRDSNSLSLNPRLDPTFGQQGATNRALRIEGAGDFSHLRALAFDTYSQGSWGPGHSYRHLTPVSSEVLRPAANGTRLRITRFLDNNNVLFTPLNAAGVDAAGNGDVEWAIEEGGPLQGSLSAPTTYTVILHREEGAANDDFQGPLCLPPNDAARLRLLAIPKEIDPEVRKLARQIAGHLPDSRKKVEAIQDYLLSHHTYSLRYNPGSGDPVSRFLLHQGSAHCEFFASSAVILLRSVGVPARYVIGYYAHESVEPGVTVVRQRDAHAWAEAWIEGTGWIVVEATPGNGRPDGLSEQISHWTRWKEWFQDHLAVVRAWLAGSNGWKAGVGVGVAALLYLAWQWRRQRRSARALKPSPFAYATPGQELAELFARFETLCRKRGLSCPEGQTWQEFLTDPPNTSPAGLPLLPLEPAREFLRTYNAVRFGGSATPVAMAGLRERLDRLERE
jgi:transglutaminase-like putative cysteine protease